MFTQIGTRATVAANLWQVQELTDSTLAVGIVSLFDGLALLVVAPLAGSITDRVDRKRLLQTAQGTSLGVSLLLSALTFTHRISPLWIYVAVTVVAAAAAFDTPARQSLVPALVPRERIVDAFALISPTGALGRLIGPAIAGVLIATSGAGAVYLFDAVTYAILILALAAIGLEKSLEAAQPQRIWHSVLEGLAYVRRRRLIWQLMSLDLSASLFASYRVLLPQLARDVFQVGPTGYGLLAAAPALGGIIGAGTVYRLRSFHRKGLVALGATILYAVAAIVLGHLPSFWLALIGAGALGLFDALASTIRNSVVQVETPDRLRGRVSSLSQMVARGGSAFGQAQLGATAAAIGGPFALTVGGAVTLSYALWLALTGRTVRDYEG